MPEDKALFAFTSSCDRTLNYEKIYLNDFNTVNEAYLGLKEYFEFYNNKRFHQSLDNQTPADVHLAGN